LRNRRYWTSIPDYDALTKKLFEVRKNLNHLRMWLKIVLEVKIKRGLKVIEKNIDEQIEIMTRVGFTASTF